MSRAKGADISAPSLLQRNSNITIPSLGMFSKQ